MRRSILLAIVITASACSAGPHHDISTAYDRVVAEKTTKIEIRSLVKLAVHEQGSGAEFPLGDPSRTTASGSVDFTSRRAALVYDFSKSQGAPESSLERSLLRYIYDDQRAFIEASFAVYYNTQGKSWVQIPVHELAKSDPLRPVDSGASDPTGLLRSLKLAGSSEIDVLKEELVRNVLTQSYGFRLQRETFLEIFDAGASRQRAKEEMERLRIRHVSIAVWIDEEGRCRRFTITFRSEDGRFDSRTTVEFYDFGTEVSVALPPPGQVRVVEDLQELQALNEDPSAGIVAVPPEDGE